MITQLLNTLSTLVPQSKVLLVGKFEERLSDAFQHYFHQIEKIDIYDELSSIQYDIVILSSKDGRGIKKLILQNELLTFDQPNTNASEDIQEDYHIDEFLDKYSGSIMFINDDLNENLEKLKDLDISKETFKSVSTNLTQLALVFQKDKKLEHIAELFLEFGQFLEHIDFEGIEPSSYGAFDLLTTIIEDLRIYINDMFVSKVLKDVYIFEDSMQNNINYFKDKLFDSKLDNEDKDEDLEFF
jgi:hypothetical protein